MHGTPSRFQKNAEKKKKKKKHPMLYKWDKNSTCLS